MIQAGGKIVGGQTPLAIVLGHAIGAARNGAKGLVVGERAEPEHDFLTARAGKIVVAEIRAIRIELHMSELQQPNSLNGELVRQRQRGVPSVDRQQRFAQFRAGRPQARHVHGIDHVDAIGNERAFAPADHLASETHRNRRRAEVELAGEVVVEQHGVLAHLLLGHLSQRRMGEGAVLVLGIVEGIAAGKKPPVVPFQFQIVGDLVKHRVNAPSVVEVTVIVVDGVGLARDSIERVGDAIERGIRILKPVERTHRKGGIEVALHVAERKNECVNRGGPGQKQGQEHRKHDSVSVPAKHGRGITRFHGSGYRQREPPWGRLGRVLGVQV